MGHFSLEAQNAVIPVSCHRWAHQQNYKRKNNVWKWVRPWWVLRSDISCGLLARRPNGIFLCALFFHSQYTEDYVRERERATLNFKYTRIHITKAQAKVVCWQFIMELHKKKPPLLTTEKRYASGGGRRFCLRAHCFYINHISTRR